MPRADKIRFTGTFSGRDDAGLSLKFPGDTALIHRGIARMLLMHCPCGCEDTLVINLDSRAGPAWRIYQWREAFSLFPSYWRDTKCESHFILWKNKICWCNWDDDTLWSNSSNIEERVLAALPDYYIPYQELAEQLQEDPWDVLLACRNLVRKKQAETSFPLRNGEFKRVAPSGKA